MVKKFNSVHKRNGRKFVLTFMENDKVKAYDVEKETEKVISINTVKRWHEVGEEIKTEPKKETKKENKKDKRKKVTAEQVLEIREKKEAGQSISSLAKEYGLSYSGMYWIVKGNTWAHLDEKKESEQVNRSKSYHWYEYRFRGFSPGCQPKGYIAVKHNHGQFGAIAYKEPLTEKQIADYELNPLEEGVTI